MTHRLQLRHRLLVVRRSDDTGVAMIMVVGVALVMTLLVSTALAYVVAVQPQARRDQDWNAALAAAQAGIDDYVARLNKSDSYAKTVDCTNIALKGPKAEANSCGWNSSTAPGWINVQPGVATAGQFHYDVDTTNFYKDGTVRLDSTGRVNGVNRTLQVRVSRGGSTEFLYYTDFEDADPANTVSYPPSGSTRVQCGASGASLAKYWWQDSGRGCSEIQFGGNDVLDGKVHFNDTPLIGGSSSSRPRFLKGFETADPACTAVKGKGDSSGNGTNAGLGACWRSTSSTNPYVGTSGAIPKSALYLPDNSDAFQNFPGCVYTGDTRIKFNSNGTMDVWNTRSAGTTLLGPGTVAGTNCGSASLFAPSADGKTPAGQADRPAAQRHGHLREERRQRVEHLPARPGRERDRLRQRLGRRDPHGRDDLLERLGLRRRQRHQLLQPEHPDPHDRQGLHPHRDDVELDDHRSHGDGVRRRAPVDVRLRVRERLPRGHGQGPGHHRRGEQRDPDRQPAAQQHAAGEHARGRGHGRARRRQLGGRVPPGVARRDDRHRDRRTDRARRLERHLPDRERLHQQPDRRRQRFADPSAPTPAPTPRRPRTPT